MFTKEQFDAAVRVAKHYDGKIDVQAIKELVVTNADIRQLVRQINDDPPYELSKVDEAELAKKAGVSVMDIRMSAAIAEGIIMGLLIGEILHDRGEN